jgi:hypothetical protein
MSRIEFCFPRLDRTPYHRGMVLILPLPAVAWLDPASVLAGVVIGLALGLAVGLLTRGRRAV